MQAEGRATREEEEEQEDGKLTPYKTDLDYLVDAVELISRKGRLYQVRSWQPYGRHEAEQM